MICLREICLYVSKEILVRANLHRNEESNGLPQVFERRGARRLRFIEPASSTRYSGMCLS